jgi:HEAT repeat protein
MTKAAVLLGLFLLASSATADEKNAETPSDKLFAKCVKILKYGSVNEFYKPAKADAVTALGILGEERAVPVLVEHLQNEEDGDLRYRIVKALGWIKSPKAVPALEKALKEDKYIHARTAAAEALKEITGKDYEPDK